jgi:CelD/BcsL family acetyltransferase involved in cellulose biosynthesis
MPTYTDGELSKYSPGKLLQIELMRWCIEHGLTIFDFTVGGEDYKHDWCDTELRLYKYTEAISIKGLMLKGADFIEEYIRRNKKLLSIAQRLTRKIRTLAD